MTNCLLDATLLDGLLSMQSTLLLAHSMTERFGQFYGGMLHPLTALEHLLPMIAISLLAGQHGVRPARCVLVVFSVGLLLGLATATVGPASEFVSTFNKASFVVLGVLVAGAFRQPPAGLLGLALIFGLTQGYENGTSGVGSTDYYLFACGAMGMAVMLVAVSEAVVVSLERDWQRIAVRVAGSWIAAIGVLILAVAPT